jgi:hypothetical protein
MKNYLDWLDYNYNNIPMWTILGVANIIPFILSWKGGQVNTLLAVWCFSNVIGSILVRHFLTHETE